MEISDFLHPNAIMLNLEARDSEEVIRVLGDKLHTLGYVKEDFVAATLEREASMPTGLPLSGEIHAAIPHVDIEYVHQPALGLATLKKAVTFYNMVEPDEEVPVRLVIMLALDKPKSQVEMLQAIAQLLQNQSLVNAIVAAETVQDVMSALEADAKEKA